MNAYAGNRGNDSRGRRPAGRPNTRRNTGPTARPDSGRSFSRTKISPTHTSTTAATGTSKPWTKPTLKSPITYSSQYAKPSKTPTVYVNKIGASAPRAANRMPDTATQIAAQLASRPTSTAATPAEPKPLWPMRINKYIAHQKIAPRRAADELIKNKKVFINGKLAVLGDKVKETDKVDIQYTGKMPPQMPPQMPPSKV